MTLTAAGLRLLHCGGDTDTDTAVLSTSFPIFCDLLHCGGDTDTAVLGIVYLFSHLLRSCYC